MALTVTTDYLKGGKGEMKCLGAMAAERLFFAVIPVTFDSSYPTGGEAIDLSGYFRDVLAMWPTSQNNQTWYVTYDETNGKLIAYVRATDAEVANTTDLSTLTVYLLVLGKE